MIARRPCASSRRNTSVMTMVGTTILVDSAKFAPPVIIRAIGDADTLFGGMGLPDGALDQIRQTDPAMVEIEKVKLMKLSAYSGSTQRTAGKVPKVIK